MRKLKVIIGLLIFACCLSSPVASAQEDYTARLDSVVEKLKSYLKESKPEWQHRSVEPLKGSQNVSVNNWELDGQIVRVSILAYGSENEAAEVMRRFAADERTLDRLPELGDGGYSWGMSGANICFRKGDLTIWVSTSTANLKEAVKLSREWAREIDAGMSSL